MLVDACSWDQAGHNPYMGTPAAAIMALTTIPEDARRVLVAKVERNAYDDHVSITRDTIAGQRAWRDSLSYMAFGSAGTVCKSVTRDRWKPGTEHRALVYCVEQWCVARPSVCGNWAIITPMPEVALLTISEPQRARLEVPEPSSWWLALVALLGVAVARWKGRGL